MEERFKFPLDFDDANDETTYGSDFKIVSFLKFRIGRNGTHNWTLKFDNKLTMKKAIKKVEDFLSRNLSEEYFNMVKDDIEHRNTTHTLYRNRGKLLGEIVLTGFTKKKPGFYMLIIDNVI